MFNDNRIETLEAEVIRLRYSNAKLVEDLARVTRERDGLAAAFLGFRGELDNESDIDDEGRPNVHMKLLMALDALAGKEGDV